MNDTVTTLRNTAKWFEAHGRNCNSAVVDICNDAAAQFESQQSQLAEAQRQRDEAIKRAEYLSSMNGQGFNW